MGWGWEMGLGREKGWAGRWVWGLRRVVKKDGLGDGDWFVEGDGLGEGEGLGREMGLEWLWIWGGRWVGREMYWGR